MLTRLRPWRAQSTIPRVLLTPFLLLPAMAWVAIGGEILPQPCVENTFYLLVNSQQGSNYHLHARMLRQKLGADRLYLRYGFNVIFYPIGEEQWPISEIASTLEDSGLAMGIIAGVSAYWPTLIPGVSSAYPAVEAEIMENPLFAQWMSDGSTVVTDLDEANHYAHHLSYSRYAFNDSVDMRAIVAAIEDSISGKIGSCLAGHANVCVINGPNEPRYGQDDIGWGGYEPPMISEFRDYLTHRGAYDDSIGVFAGLGYPGGGQFADDPSPSAAAPDTEECFNDVFGTQFTTWSLRYWDPVVFEGHLAWAFSDTSCGGQLVYCDSLVYVHNGQSRSAKTIPSAEDSLGFVDVGFDAPRSPGAGRFFKAWTDPDGVHESFRPRLVHWAQEACFRSRSDGGIPGARTFSHGQANGSFANGVPLWVFDVYDGGLGITLLGSATTNADGILTRISAFGKDWGSFQFNPVIEMLHPDHYAPHDSVEARMKAALDSCYSHRAHYLAFLPNPFWVYMDSSFYSDPVLEFMNRRTEDSSHYVFENPYFNDTWIDYDPPQVLWADAALGPLGAELVWADSIWADQKFEWEDWSEAAVFTLARKRGFITSAMDTVGVGEGNCYRDSMYKRGDQYSVSVLTKAGKVGDALWFAPDVLRPMGFERGKKERNFVLGSRRER